MIDMHSHYYGEVLTESLLSRTSPPFIKESGNNSHELITPTGRFPYTAHFFEKEPVLRKQFMEENAISKQLLTFPGALAADILPITEAHRLITAFNSELAEICVTHSQSFIGLAGLPLADVASAAAELKRVRVKSGLLGAILPANFFCSVERAKKLAPVFEVGNKYGAHFMLHPGLRDDESLTVKPYPDFHVHRWSTVGLQSAVSQAAITLMFSDLTDVYPNISFQLVNLGGTIPFVAERMDHIAMLRTPERPQPSALTKKMYYDNASFGHNSLELAIKVYGSERIFFGTDYPIFRSGFSREALKKADISESTRKSISEKNADGLLSRLLSLF